MLKYILPITYSHIFELDPSKWPTGNSDDTSFGFSLTMTENGKDNHVIIGSPRASNSAVLNERTYTNHFRGKVENCTIFDTQLDCNKEIELDYTDSQGMSYITRLNNDRGNEEQMNFNVRYHGMNLNYDKTSKQFMTCAPASYQVSSKDKYYGNGICLQFNMNGGSRDYIKQMNKQDKEHIFYKNYELENREMKGKKIIELAGFQSAKHPSKIGKTVFSAPTASAWRMENNKRVLTESEEGQLLLTDYTGSGRASEKKKMKNIKNAVGSVDERLGVSLATYSCSGKNYVAAGTSTPFGKVNIYRLSISDDSASFVTSLSSGEKEFGSVFGFSLLTVELNRKPHLIVTSPFGVSGKIELFDLCTYSKIPKPANHKIIDTDRQLEKLQYLGYSLSNLGDIDSIPGDEIAVGFPAKKKGGVVIFSVRGDTIKVSQIIQPQSGQDEYMHFGLSLSDVALNLDSFAGADLAVSSKKKVSIIYSAPVFSLAKHVEFSYQGQRPTEIDIHRPAAGFSFKACMEFNSNVDLGDIDILVDMSPDSLRDNQNSIKRYSLANEKDIKLVKTRGKWCTGFLQAKITDHSRFQCSDKNVIDISQSVKLEVQNIRAKNTEKVAFVDSGMRTNDDIEMRYSCKGDCSDDLRIEKADRSLGELILSKGTVSKDMNLTISNKGKKDIYGAFLKIKVDDFVTVDNSECLQELQSPDEYNCPLKCPLAPGESQDLDIILKFNNVKGDRLEYEINYNIVKDHKDLGSFGQKGSKKFKVKYAINPLVEASEQVCQNVDFDENLETVLGQFDTSNCGADQFGNHEISFLNGDDLIQYEKYQFEFHVPIAVSISGEKVAIFHDNDFEITTKNDESILSKHNHDYDCIKNKKEGSNGDASVVQSGKQGVDYYQIVCTPKRFPILMEKSNPAIFEFKPTFSNNFLFQYKKMETTLNYYMTGVFKVLKITNLDQNLAKTTADSGQVSEKLMSLEFEMVSDDNPFKQHKWLIIICASVAFLVVLIIAVLLYKCGFFGKAVEEEQHEFDNLGTELEKLKQ